VLHEGERSAISDVSFGQARITIHSGNKLALKWNNGRRDASGQIDETKTPHRGWVTFPDDRKYSFWFYPSEKTIYWDADKGRTNNIWRGN